MKEYKREFIDFCLDNRVLTFGQFKLKSGRTSPYFFNAGLFNTGQALSRLGEFYADALMDSCTSGSSSVAGISSGNIADGIDLLFGPAYKGIPLVSVLASTLYRKYGKNYPYAFNRKEAKDHGEGGVFVGSKVTGRVLVVDDVITAGTAIRETVNMLNGCEGAKLAAVLIALDRKEVAPGGGGQLSAIDQVIRDHGVPVISIVNLTDILDHLRSKGGHDAEIKSIEEYQKQFGC
jgi:orotate phosphoribosyltransferase